MVKMSFLKVEIKRYVWSENDTKYLTMASDAESWLEHALFSSRIDMMDLVIGETVKGYSLRTFSFNKTESQFLSVNMTKSSLNEK